MEEKRATDLSDNDEDSGNDEPPYNLPVVQSIHHNDRNGEQGPPAEPEEMAVIAQPANKESRSTSAENKPANKEKRFSDNRPNPDPPRNLRQYISALTEARDEIGHLGVAMPGPSAFESTDRDRATKKACEKREKPGSICDLPVEVLLSVFSYLDDLSLCNVGEVCIHWRKILEIHTPQTMWERHTKQRWPLFRPFNRASDWLKVIE